MELIPPHFLIGADVAREEPRARYCVSFANIAGVSLAKEQYARARYGVLHNFGSHW